ncbi:cytochrome P450 [Dictyobacter kobayashii]|uniref:Cytochrome P450 n=1 Tax=Dictyobacter kobayashii TaxID=2014872 RepID=A0A402AZ51_9CHLR|nr:cytochrome P450 [Dictyobacter kobayashii]GCE24389.1 cytochrome P450 [Dictyobacter kobayashii]
MAEQSLFQQINDYKNRANPYPLYAEMLKTPVIRESDGNYAVSSYRLVTSLLHDPRLSSDARNLPSSSAKAQAVASSKFPIPFIRLDPPDHDRLRRMVTRQFGPPHTTGLIAGMHQELENIVNELLDHVQGRKQIDIVDDFSYPFPVTVICRLLGVPHEDEQLFHAWADALVESLDPEMGNGEDLQMRQKALTARNELSQYMSKLIAARQKQPGNDMLSKLANDNGPDGRLTTEDLVSTSGLLLIAGHETTVNLITNGMLTLLRHPEVLERLRKDPELAIPLVEELLRFEPPVQFSSQRVAIADIQIDGQTIPKGSQVYLMLAAANRDPERFPDPERFIPDRQDNEHLGFGSGIHYCFGAPLARLEVQIALNALAQRLINPRLAVDPPPYRPGAVLRGPATSLSTSTASNPTNCNRVSDTLFPGALTRPCFIYWCIGCD